MSLPTSHTLDVPGARLYYEVQGTGPVLMLVGHPMGALGFASIAPLLAEDFTVVTYDPRGFDRSPIDDPDQDADPDLLADDARRVLEAIGTLPAHVFGSSGGAVTGLALVARSPGLVRTLIAHEAPLAVLLPEAEEAPAGMQEIYDTYRDRGIPAAWGKFSSFTGLDMFGEGEPADPQPASAEEMAASNRFFSHGLLPIALYRPDFPALEGVPARLIVACGSASKGEFPQRTAVALAERLGIRPVVFPGGHVGFITEPRAFADVLRYSLAAPP
jgi:pimeloyl-ACP methyl ester carboxylesterase